MAQRDDRHLTITQISAYKDKELAPDELAFCDAHLQSCQSCQALLKEIQLTSALLKKLPQAEVPRSFVLPTNMAVLPQGRSGRSTSRWSRSLRVMSTIAAVLGLIFFLFGVVTSVPFAGPGGTATTSSGVSQAPQAAPAAHPSVNSGSQPRSIKHTPPVPGHASASSPSFVWPAALDPTQPVGRLGIGFLLILLGLLGLLISSLWSRLNARRLQMGP